MWLAFREEEKLRVARPELLAARAKNFRAQLGFYRRARHFPSPPTALSLCRSAQGLRPGAIFTRPAGELRYSEIHAALPNGRRTCVRVKTITFMGIPKKSPRLGQLEIANLEVGEQAAKSAAGYEAFLPRASIMPNFSQNLYVVE